MQFYALTKERVLCSAPEALRQTDYFCLECQKVVRVRGGHHRRLHFFHLDPSPSCRLNGKSLTHLAIQLHLLSLFPGELLLEECFPSIARIADCVHPQKKLIFEIQCSFITAKEVKERIMAYNSIGYNVVWILHEKEFNRRRLKNAELFLKKHLHLYTNMDSERRGSFFQQEAHDVGPFRLHYGPKKQIDLKSLSLPPLNRWKRLLIAVKKFLKRG